MSFLGRQAPNKQIRNNKGDAVPSNAFLSRGWSLEQIITKSQSTTYMETFSTAVYVSNSSWVFRGVGGSRRQRCPKWEQDKNVQGAHCPRHLSKTSPLETFIWSSHNCLHVTKLKLRHPEGTWLKVIVWVKRWHVEHLNEWEGLWQGCNHESMGSDEDKEAWMCPWDRQYIPVGLAQLIVEDVATGMHREGFWALLTILKNQNASPRTARSELGFRKPCTVF